MAIWIARNRLIFESKIPNWNAIFDLTFHNLAFWLKSSVRNFSYTSSDLFRNLECIMNWTNQLSPSLLIFFFKFPLFFLIFQPPFTSWSCFIYNFLDYYIKKVNNESFSFHVQKKAPENFLCKLLGIWSDGDFKFMQGRLNL